MTEEDIDDLISRFQKHMEYKSPYEHLYEWLQAKDPMLFKQWQAVYDIFKEN